jgi:hypothetical protein
VTISDWASLTSIALGIGGAITLGIRWTIKHYLAELKPNGGSSLNDTIKLEILPLVKELRDNQITIGEKVARLEGRFDQHIDDE